MAEPTILDTGFAAMSAGGDAARLRFYETLADSTLIVPLEREPDGDNIAPEMFETGEGRFVLGFDREERLLQFTDAATPVATLTGRVLVRMLAGQGIGLGLNLDVAPSSMLIPANAVDWLDRTLTGAPDQIEARVVEYQRPDALPPALFQTLAAKLASGAGLARAAYLVAVRYEDGGQGHLLGFVGAAPPVRAAVAKAVAEALTFSGLDQGVVDVGFFEPEDKVVATLARHGLWLDLTATKPVPRPHRDSSKPPILR